MMTIACIVTVYTHICVCVC